MSTSPITSTPNIIVSPPSFSEEERLAVLNKFNISPLSHQKSVDQFQKTNDLQKDQKTIATRQMEHMKHIREIEKRLRFDKVKVALVSLPQETLITPKRTALKETLTDTERDILKAEGENRLQRFYEWQGEVPEPLITDERRREIMKKFDITPLSELDIGTLLKKLKTSQCDEIIQKLNSTRLSELDLTVLLNKKQRRTLATSLDQEIDTNYEESRKIWKHLNFKKEPGFEAPNRSLEETTWLLAEAKGRAERATDLADLKQALDEKRKLFKFKTTSKNQSQPSLQISSSSTSQLSPSTSQLTRSKSSLDLLASHSTIVIPSKRDKIFTKLNKLIQFCNR